MPLSRASTRGRYSRTVGVTGVLSLISMGTAQNVQEYIEYSRIIHFHHKKGGADMFKALQHIKAKSYKLRTNLVDFGGNAQKE